MIKLLLFLLAINCAPFAMGKVYDFMTKLDPNDLTLLLANKLPMFNGSLDYRVMPYVGNGHQASTIFNNAVFLNGLYNGIRGESHRARVPNIHNFSFISPANGFTFRQYALDMKNGMFIEQLEDEMILIERKIFAHQYYNRLLVTHVQVKRKQNVKGTININLDYAVKYESEDFNFEKLAPLDNYWLLRGKTKDIEFEEFQKETRDLFMYFNEPASFSLDEDENQALKVFISSTDWNDDPAKEEFELAKDAIENDRVSDFVEKHTNAFGDIWEFGRIETDNRQLQSNIYSSYYYLLSSLPALKHHGVLNQFYGLSPGSLSRGGHYQDYQGHSFWDTETWMFPSVLMLYPSLAKEILSYRISLRDAAVKNAQLFNTSGWRFPWESAYTGLDVTPDCCPEVKLYQLHINGDIAYAARQYYSATRDNDWLYKENGYELINKLAEFWASRISYSSSKQEYEILGVLPPDEDAQPNVNNSVYTNIIASLAIFYANYTTCLGQNQPLNDQMIKKARCLHIPYDDSRNFHLEYEGYADKQIKQADVVLIGFPLMWPMDPIVRKNDLLFYENKTRINGPAMTWGMHAIGFIELGEYEKAAQLLNRSYQVYVKEPFNTWTEAYQEVGAVNFITGAGGFLQTLMFGYAGLRLHVEELRFNSKLPLPAGSNYLYLHKIKYLGSTLSFNHTASKIYIYVDSIDQTNNLELVTKEKTYDLKDGQTIEVDKVDFENTIRSKSKTNCPLPYDKIDYIECASVSKGVINVFIWNWLHLLLIFLFINKF